MHTTNQTCALDKMCFLMCTPFVVFMANWQAGRKIWHRQEKAGIIYWTVNRKRTFLGICQPGAGVTGSGPSETKSRVHNSSLVLCLSTSFRRGWNGNVSVFVPALHWVWHDHWHTSGPRGITRKSRPWTARKVMRRKRRRWGFCTLFACFRCEERRCDTFAQGLDCHKHKEFWESNLFPPQTYFCLHQLFHYKLVFS